MCTRYSAVRFVPVVLGILASAPGCAVLRGGGPGPGAPSPRPTLAAEGREDWTRAFAAVNGVLLRNLDGPDWLHAGRHAHPAPAILGVYLWDTAFLCQAWKVWDVGVAQDAIQSVLDGAWEGRLPHYSLRISHSALTQPPLIAWSLWEVYRWGGDREALARAYPVLKAYNRWLYENRRLPSGLFFWKAPEESGMDNSPRFAPPGRSPLDPRTLGAVDLSSYVALQDAVLSRMAGVLHDREDSVAFARQAEELRALVDSLLWDEHAGYYFDRDEGSGELNHIRTSASFLPLLAGVPDSVRAARLRDHILDPEEFNSPVPLPSVALNDPAFSRDMWRGPVWINVSYAIIQGLAEYGYQAEAADLAWRTVEGVYGTYRATGRVWEFYDPFRLDVRALHRKRGDTWKHLTLGDGPLPDYAWSGLANTLLIERVLGYAPDGEEWVLTPRFPASAGGLRLRVTLPGRGLVVRLEVHPDGSSRGEIETATGREEFALRPGEGYRLSRSQHAPRSRP